MQPTHRWQTLIYTSGNRRWAARMGSKSFRSGDVSGRKKRSRLGENRPKHVSWRCFDEPLDDPIELR
jgi:hypothetical protein